MAVLMALHLRSVDACTSKLIIIAAVINSNKLKLYSRVYICYWLPAYSFISKSGSLQCQNSIYAKNT